MNFVKKKILPIFLMTKGTMFSQGQRRWILEISIIRSGDLSTKEREPSDPAGLCSLVFGILENSDFYVLTRSS